MDMMKHMQATMQCVAKNCKKQRAEIQKKQKQYIADLMKLLNSKSQDKEKKAKALTLKMYKCNERMKLIECQLDKCYNQTEKMIKSTIASILKTPNSPMYKVAKKYEKIFKKGITPKKLLEYDIAAMKL